MAPTSVEWPPTARSVKTPDGHPTTLRGVKRRSRRTEIASWRTPREISIQRNYAGQIWTLAQFLGRESRTEHDVDNERARALLSAERSRVEHLLDARRVGKESGS